MKINANYAKKILIDEKTINVISIVKMVNITANRIDHVIIVLFLNIYQVEYLVQRKMTVHIAEKIV